MIIGFGSVIMMIIGGLIGWYMAKDEVEKDVRSDHDRIFRNAISIGPAECKIKRNTYRDRFDQNNRIFSPTDAQLNNDVDGRWYVYFRDVSKIHDVLTENG